METSTNSSKGIFDSANADSRDHVIELLTKAYWMEIETVTSYLAASVNLDGVRAQEIKQSLEEDIEEELGHARRFARRIKELYGVVPGSEGFVAEQSYLQPSEEQTDVVHVIRGVIEAESGAIEHYTRIIDETDQVDPVTQDMTIEILHDEQGHRRSSRGSCASTSSKASPEAATRRRRSGARRGPARGCRRGEGRGDQAACLGRVDHVVDLEEGGGVERLGVLFGGGGEVADAALALGLVVDRLELLAQGELDRALQAHRAEVGGRPGDGEQRLVHAAAGHRLGAEAVAAAQDHGDQRHAQGRAGDQQAGGVADQAGRLGLGADHHPRGVDQRDDGQAEGVAELQEAGRLVGGVAGDRAGHVAGVVGDHAERATLDAGEGGDHLGAKRSRRKVAEPSSASVSTIGCTA